MAITGTKNLQSARSVMAKWRPILISMAVDQQTPLMLADALEEALDEMGYGDERGSGGWVEMFQRDYTTFLSVILVRGNQYSIPQASAERFVDGWLNDILADYQALSHIPGKPGYREKSLMLRFGTKAFTDAEGELRDIVSEYVSLVEYARDMCQGLYENRNEGEVRRHGNSPDMRLLRDSWQTLRTIPFNIRQMMGMSPNVFSVERKIEDYHQSTVQALNAIRPIIRLAEEMGVHPVASEMDSICDTITSYMEQSGDINITGGQGAAFVSQIRATHRPDWSLLMIFADWLDEQYDGESQNMAQRIRNDAQQAQDNPNQQHRIWGELTRTILSGRWG